MRKSRPLARDQSTFRDDRLVLVACDDTYAPKQYLSFYNFRRVKVKVVETTDGSSAAEHVLARLLDFACQDDDERWLVLDTDHITKGSHLKGLRKAIQRARKLKVNIAMSRPCFEVWLLLHHCNDLDHVRSLTSAADTLKELRKVVPSYRKNLVGLSNFPVASVARAIAGAISLDKDAKLGIIPSCNTTRVYQLWESILKIENIGSSHPIYGILSDALAKKPTR